MPDGSRKRRHSTNLARRRWYAQHRSQRFGRRFGFCSPVWPLTRRAPLSSRMLETAL